MKQKQPSIAELKERFVAMRKERDDARWCIQALLNAHYNTTRSFSSEEAVIAAGKALSNARAFIEQCCDAARHDNEFGKRLGIPLPPAMPAVEA